ncbi:hypothetical protein [Vagococcus intermedius]|uniref:Uncharacterized protein n=1 Tax=Vagococcus intermedius TaxID=2991418 RepID=A0AAF0I637_9ENTE|nr:hypothetical protein [Vagococcus intermedius]WEG72539.1 hypothetical protein OL234_06000 [Vagococcus intermedius]WEG74626.1 hypothetical protein OL235_06005 [Vagococcus intermedius]
MKKTTITFAILTLFIFIGSTSLVGSMTYPTKLVEKNCKAKTNLSDNAQKIISDKFYDWAVTRAEESKQAVTPIFFSPEEHSIGDWFGQTPDGKILVSKNDESKWDDFPLHAMGGVVFYTALNGQIGHDPEIDYRDLKVDYEVNMDETMPASKYILGDNGIVYELVKITGEQLTPTSGFKKKIKDNLVEVPEKENLIKSKDQEAQNVLGKLINTYCES